MKKVLIIGGFWPYRSGSRRIISLVKYLPKFGWEPIVLTPPLERKLDISCRVIKTGYKDFLGLSNQDMGETLRDKYKGKPIRKVINFFYNPLKEILAYPDEDKNWKSIAIEAAEKLIRGEYKTDKIEKIDAIISVWPETSHLVAKHLKEKYGIPWIADFPDLWSQNCNYPYGRIRRFFDRRLEIKTMSTADALITTSPPWAEELSKIHKDKQVYSITHGFDEKMLGKSSKLTKKFTLIYPGIFYNGMRDLKKVLVAIENLIGRNIIEKKDVRIEIYGTDLNFPDSDIIYHGGKIPQYLCVQKERQSQVLLLLKWEDPKDKGIYSGKIFEYLAVKRPILATGGYDDVITNLIKETKVGIEAQTVKDIENALIKMYSEYKTDGVVIYEGDEKAIQKYSLNSTIKQFVNLLDRI